MFVSFVLITTNNTERTRNFYINRNCLMSHFNEGIVVEGRRTPLFQATRRQNVAQRWIINLLSLLKFLHALKENLIVTVREVIRNIFLPTSIIKNVLTIMLLVEQGGEGNERVESKTLHGGCNWNSLWSIDNLDGSTLPMMFPARTNDALPNNSEKSLKVSSFVWN